MERKDARGRKQEDKNIKKKKGRFFLIYSFLNLLLIWNVFKDKKERKYKCDGWGKN